MLYTNKRFRSPVNVTIIGVAKDVSSIILGVVFIAGGTLIGITVTGTLAVGAVLLTQLPSIIFRPYTD